MILKEKDNCKKNQRDKNYYNNKGNNYKPRCKNKEKS